MLRITQAPVLRIDAIVLNADRSITCEQMPKFEPDASLVRLAFESYGYILRALRVERPCRLTMNDFADEICKVYSRQDPRNRQVLAALERAHASIERRLANQGVPA